MQANHDGAELVEKAKHGDGAGELEARVSVPPFAEGLLCNERTLYGKERHCRERKRE